MGSKGKSKSSGYSEDTIVSRPETDTASDESLQKFRGFAKGGGWYFEGNEWTDKWFSENSNVDELINGMDAGTIDAFHAYTRGYFMGGEMYQDPKSLSRSERLRLRAITNTLDKASLDKGVVVYRRSTFELVNNGSDRSLSVADINARKGEIIPCKGCLSASAAREGLDGMGWKSKPVEYEIEIPAGKGSGMWIGKSTINPGWGARQREFLTNADANYEIRGAREDTRRGVTIVTLRYQGHGKHRW